MRDGEGGIVWVFLVERDVAAGGDLELFDDEPGATSAAALYVGEHWPDPVTTAPDDPAEAIAAFNGFAHRDEHVVVGAWPVHVGQ